MTAHNTRRPCPGCGTTRTHRALCQTCEQGGTSLGLTNGRWVAVKGVQRWHPDLDTPAVVEEVAWVKTCRRCGADGARQFLCESCAVESDRRSKRDYMRRIRAKRKAAAA